MGGVPDEPLKRPLFDHLHPLHGFRLKFNRAQAHADALNGQVDTWLADHPYGVYGEYEPGDPEYYVFKVRFLDPVPPEWSVTLGDFAHNARSALDHLAYQVVMDANGGNDEWTQFPIVVSPWDWKTQCKKCIGHASERHREMIQALQPYQRTDLYGFHSIWSAIEHPLAILNRLSNIDKHRVLNPTPVAITSIGYDVKPVRDIASHSTAEVRREMLIDGEEMLRVQIVSSGPNPEMSMKRRETVEIRVQHRIELGPDHYTLWSVPLKESLDAVLESLRHIFEVFVAEFA